MGSIAQLLETQITTARELLKQLSDHKLSEHLSGVYGYYNVTLTPKQAKVVEAIEALWPEGPQLYRAIHETRRCNMIRDYLKPQMIDVSDSTIARAFRASRETHARRG